MSVIDELSKLEELRKNGTLTDEEFVAQKKLLLQGKSVVQIESEWSEIPFWKKGWFQCLSILIFVPLGVVVMMCFPAYQLRKGKVEKIGKGLKAFLILLSLFAWAMVVLNNLYGS